VKPRFVERLATDLGPELAEAAAAAMTGADPAAAARRDADRSSWHHEQWDVMHDLEWTTMVLAEDAGGGGASFADLAGLSEVIGETLYDTALSAHSLALLALSWAAPGTARSQGLEIALDGGHLAVVPGPEFGIRLNGDRLDGHGPILPDLALADWLIVSALDPDGEAAIFLLPRTRPGIDVVCDQLVDRTRLSASVDLRSVTVVPDDRLDLPLGGVQALADLAAVLTACDALGGARRSLEMTVDYLTVRHQFDRPLGSFQALQHRCAELLVRLEMTSALVQTAVDFAAAFVPGNSWPAASRRLELSRAASAAKSYATDAYVLVAGEAMQLHGGIGYTWEHDCHLHLKRALVDQAAGTANDDHRRSIFAQLRRDTLAQ
jgi:alkylation response protein AidB-like acyl-CoA dehydrogenase